MPSITVPDVIKYAHFELNTYQPAQPINNPDGQASLFILNELLDSWNAEREKVWAEVFSQFTLVLKQPIEIGPGGDFVLAVRPVSADGFSLMLTTGGGPPAKVPINIRDYRWWLSTPLANQSYANTIQSSVITDIYYQPDWPKGKLYCYPAPNTAYTLVVVTRTLLAQVTMADSLDFPPGYQMAFRLTLAEKLCTGFGRAVPEKLEKDARAARAVIEANNDDTPTLVTRDAGMPGGQRHRPDFFWPDGRIK